MQRLYFLFCACFFISYCDFSFAQAFKILHYTQTSGFDHQTRDVSYAMFQQLGSQHNFIVDNDSTGYSFNAASNLNQYAIIVFANTTGDTILDSTQRSHFEQYIINGGNVIGIHSATDTYRHSSANGSNTGVWDFFPELLGASVQQSPTHVNGTPFYTMHAMQAHPLLSNISNPWYKAEEYYYWESGYFDSLNNNILLKVDSTVGPNGLVNSYDSSRATAWYRVTPLGNLVFYTSLGHAATNYTSDTLFIQLIRNAVLWAAGVTGTIEKTDGSPMDVACYPNPFTKKVTIQLNNKPEKYNLQIFNTMKQEVFKSKNLTTNIIEIDFKNLPCGIYFLRLDFKNSVIIKKLVKK